MTHGIMIQGTTGATIYGYEFARPPVPPLIPLTVILDESANAVLDENGATVLEES